MASKKIYIKLKPGEWKTLENKITAVNKLLRREIPKLKTKFDENPNLFIDSSGKTKQRSFFISEQSFMDLTEICSHTGKPMATTITELILMPHLRP